MKIFHGSFYVRSFEKRMIEANKKYWEKRSNITEGEKWIYCFHSVQSSISYCTMEGVISKGLQEKEQLPIASITCGTAGAGGRGRKAIDELDVSFGIEQIDHFDLDDFGGVISRVRTAVSAAYLALFTYKKRKKLLRIKYRGICCGDAIYDDILRMNPYMPGGRPVFDCFDVDRSTYYLYIRNALSIIDKSYKIFSQRKPAYIVTSEFVYIRSLVVSVASSLGAHLLLTGPTDLDPLPMVLARKKFLVEIKVAKILERQIQHILEKDTLADQTLDHAFVMEPEKADERGILEYLGVPAGKKNVFIMLHCLSDAPRGGSDQSVYIDYNKWFLDTLRIIKEVKGVNWIIKDHPLSTYYSQDSYVREIFDANKTENMFWCEKNISGLQIKEVADCVVTCAGDVGIEYWAYGIPTVTTADAYYSKWNISYNMKTLEEYEDVLKNISKLKKPSVESMVQAQKCLIALKKMGTLNIDEVVRLFYTVASEEANSLKDVYSELPSVRFCKKYIELLNADHIRDSVIYQLRNTVDI